MQKITFSPDPINLVTPEPVISVRNLNHYFGDGVLRKQVLFDINLEIDKSEIVIMTGPSGSGKTTLLTRSGWTAFCPIR